MEEDVSTFFEPERNSAALIFLRRLVGCTFDYIWTPSGGGNAGNSCTGNGDVYDIIASLIEVLNWASLSCIAGVATYLIFAALKDTANDGQAGGRSMNPSWTLVMAAIGAILCFPAFNGFSALQMGTMQVAVWSTGLGDKMWSTAAEKMANANAVDQTFNAVFKSEGTDSWIPFQDDDGSPGGLRQQIAKGLKDRIAGELCATGIVDGAKSMATPTDVTISSAQESTSGSATDSRASEKLYYTGGGAFAQSVGLCGSITVSYVKSPALEGPASTSDANLMPVSNDSERQIAASLRDYSNAASAAVAGTIASEINSRARSLHTYLFPASGARLTGKEQVDRIAREVGEIVVAAQKAGKDALAPALPGVQQLTRQAMSRNTENGWMYAVLYQRLLATSTMGLSNLADTGITVATTAPTNSLSKAFNCGWGGCSEQLDVFFRQYRNDLETLEELDGTFVAAAEGSDPSGTNASTQPDVTASTNAIARSIGEFLNGFVAKNSDNSGWVDPIPQIQQNGTQIMGIGVGIAGVGVIGEFLGELLPGVGGAIGKAAGMIGPFGWFLIFIGWVLAVVIPYMPLIYFFLAAFSWLVLVIQTIISAPLVLMQMFYPNRQGGIGGTSLARMLVLLLGLLLRPALIIIGLIFCMAAMRVGMDFLNVLMSGALPVLTYTNTSGVVSAIGAIGIAVGGFFIYTSVVFLLVSTCCSLIDGVAEFVMDMVENGVGRLVTSEARTRSEGALGSPAAAVGGLALMRPNGSLAGSKARQLGQRIRERGQKPDEQTPRLGRK